MKDDSEKLVFALGTVAAALGVGLLVFWPRKKEAPPKTPTVPITPVSSVLPIYYADFTAGIFKRALKVGETFEVAMPPGPTYHVQDDFPGESVTIAGGAGLVRFDPKTGYSYAKYIALKPGAAVAMITTEGEPGVSMTIGFTVT